MRFRITLLWGKKYQVAVDLAILALAFTLSYLLRFDFQVPNHEIHHYKLQLPFVVAVQWVAMLSFGVYSFIWRYVGMREINAFVYAGVASALPILAFRLTLPPGLAGYRVPLSIIILDGLLVFLGTLGVRGVRRAIYEWFEESRPEPGSKKRTSVLLIGAGRAGQYAATEILRNSQSEIEIEGFVDDDPHKVGAIIAGFKVLGKTADLAALVHEHKIDHVIITIASASRQQYRRILDICDSIAVRVRVIPSLSDLMHGKLKVSRIRDLQIDDLLGRPPVVLLHDGMRAFLEGRAVMVTGAGGSIGSELARQIACYHPAKLILVERAEFALFSIHRELSEAWPGLEICPHVTDVGNEARMRHLFATHLPQVVIHAAAHKHVPMMETNVAEAVSNNVFTTSVLGELAGEFGVQAFVLISTDKAVRPTSVMGACKRAAELTIQQLQQRYRTRYVAVRFGNVIGSQGSVIPIFYEQIRKGGSVTVTHPEMKRYFMTIPEAAQLVLQAATMGEGGEIFILDMGEPVKILDVAKDVITLSGLRPFKDIDIVFTGLRPGEKLFEELVISEEYMAKTRHPRIYIGKIAGCSQAQLERALQRMAILYQQGDEAGLRDVLAELIPEAAISRKKAAAAMAGAPPIRHPVAPGSD